MWHGLLIAISVQNPILTTSLVVYVLFNQIEHSAGFSSFGASIWIIILPNMSYYDNQQWSAGAAGQPSWEQQTPPARSGMLGKKSHIDVFIRVSIDRCYRYQLSCSARGLHCIQHTNRGYVYWNTWVTAIAPFWCWAMRRRNAGVGITMWTTYVLYWLDDGCMEDIMIKTLMIWCIEVDRAIDNLVKSGKMFNLPAGGRRDSMPLVGPSRTFPEQFGMLHVQTTT